MDVLRGRVVEVDGRQATLELENGEQRVVAVPEPLDVRVGTTVKIVDTGDAKPIYAWG